MVNFYFPEVVNDKSARIVATGVCSLSMLFLLTSNPLVLIVMAFGFITRVAWGPKVSPLARFAVYAGNRLGQPRLVPGTPKRFAQTIGTAFTLGALAAYPHGYAPHVIGVLLFAASLEAVFGFCVGCKVFAVLIRFRVVPKAVCIECSDISSRLARVGS